VIRIRTLTIAMCLTAVAARAAGPAVGPPIDLLAPSPSVPTPGSPQPHIEPMEPAPPATDTPPRASYPAPLPRAPIPPAPVQRMFPYAQLPGHWQLYGAQYVWVPPEKTARPVTYWTFVPGQYAWRHGAWAWVPPHYE
jgi:hypothetical protein